MQRRSFLSFTLGGVGAALAASIASGKEASVSGSTAETFEVTKTEAEWRKILSPAAFEVLRRSGTERPGSSSLNTEHRAGTFFCAGCDLALFSSTAKFDSGTGWPSFTAPLPNAVGTSTDRSYFETRTEVHCRRCGGHLGHVFDDGPAPTGKRYCMNGVALTFRPTGA